MAFRDKISVGWMKSEYEELEMNVYGEGRVRGDMKYEQRYWIWGMRNKELF